MINLYHRQKQADHQSGSHKQTHNARVLKLCGANMKISVTNRYSTVQSGENDHRHFGETGLLQLRRQRIRQARFLAWLLFDSEEGGDMFFRNVHRVQADFTKLYFKRPRFIVTAVRSSVPTKVLMSAVFRDVLS